MFMNAERGAIWKRKWQKIKINTTSVNLGKQS